MEHVEIIYKLIITSLLALLVIAIACFSYYIIERRFNKSILSYSAFTFTLLIVVLVLLVVLAWQAGNLKFEFINYFFSKKILSELLVSVVMVISFVGTRIALNLFRQLILTLRTPRLSKLLYQWDSGEISDAKINEELILYSLQKWINREDESGWYELKEFLSVNQKVATRKPHNLIKDELMKIERAKKKNINNTQQRKYESNLKLILPHIVVSRT